jgi:hypothetical protein
MHGNGLRRRLEITNSTCSPALVAQLGGPHAAPEHSRLKRTLGTDVLSAELRPARQRISLRACAYIATRRVLHHHEPCRL